MRSAWRTSNSWRTIRTTRSSINSAALLVGEVNQLEILAIGGITITELDKHIRDIIVSNGSRPKTLALVKGTSDWLSAICC
jgi:hypothetical protein